MRLLKLYLAALALSYINLSSTNLNVVAAELDDASQSLIETLRPSVVQVQPTKRHAQSGVIVSSTGHVVWTGTAVPTSDLDVRLQTGEVVTATNLGWSEEFGLGLLKLNGDRTYPEVRMHLAYESLEGDSCVEIGYRSTGGDTQRVLEARFGEVLFSQHDHWLLTDLEPTPFEYGAGLFNRAGELVGLSVPGVSTEHHICISSEVVRKHAKHLSRQRNLDWMRFPPARDAAIQALSSVGDAVSVGVVPVDQLAGWPTQLAKTNAPDFSHAKETATKATVAIARKKNAWPDIERPFRMTTSHSGVVVSDTGLVATCSHSLLLPGDAVEVSFNNGKMVTADVVWMDWVSDIGLLQINSTSELESVDLSPSSRVHPYGSVLCSGFPARAVGGNAVPVFTTEVLPLQQTPYVGWNNRMLLGRSLSLFGGASGGGVFNEGGSLTGILLGPGEVYRSEALGVKIEEYQDSVDGYERIGQSF